jgi:CCR4-NOT complex subunit CAF16
MRFGTLVESPTHWPISNSSAQFSASSSLHSIALSWLKDDRAYQQGHEKQGMKTRGARKNEVSRFYHVSALS